MSRDPEYSSELPSEEQIEEGRKGALFIGLAIGGVVVVVGIVAYLLFGKYFTF